MMSRATKLINGSLRRQRRGLRVRAGVGALLAGHIDLVDQVRRSVVGVVSEGAVALLEGAAAVENANVVLRLRWTMMRRTRDYKIS